MRWSPHQWIYMFEALGGKVLADPENLYFGVGGMGGMGGMGGTSDLWLWQSLGRGARRALRIRAIARVARARG